MASITDQNWVVWNQGKNPLVNFNFMLRVELAVDLPCKSVRAFSRELEYDYIQEGGLNDYVHMRRKPITRPFTLEIERYVGVDYLDPLPLGTDLTLPVLLFVSRNHDQFIPGVVARTYVFTGCTVMKKTYGDLVADQSGLLVETTTLGYREMLCVDIPWSEVGDNISKDVKTVPTAARTLDKSAAELKALGNELYLQAQAAKEQAETALSAQDAQALIDELTGTLADLRAAVDKGGSLVQAADRAEAGRNGAGGHPKTELADQAQAAAQQAEKDFRAKEQLAQEADAALYRAEDALRQAKEAGPDRPAGAGRGGAEGAGGQAAGGHPHRSRRPDCRCCRPAGAERGRGGPDRRPTGKAGRHRPGPAEGGLRPRPGEGRPDGQGPHRCPAGAGPGRPGGGHRPAGV